MINQPQIVPQCDIANVANQSVVMIAVRNNQLSLYPRRTNDVVAYYHPVPEKSSPEKPNEVRWVVGGLGPNQSVRIVAKTPGTGLFPSDEFEINSACNSIRSGFPQMGPGAGTELNWCYSVVLLENGIVIDTIDPMIIIKNDP
jgi:hypothetical protein